jgi:DNA-binding transcriptional LysR family regulator
VLDLHRLRLLRELQRRGTLAAVAAALSYSPSAISQQLALLEAETGVTLLDRVGRGVALTAQAHLLVAHTEELLARMEHAEADLAASLSGVVGTLRVAAFQTAAHALLPAALTALSARHPTLRVEVTEMEPEQSLPALVARDFDLVLGEEYPGHPHPPRLGLERADLSQDRLRLALPPDFAAGRGGDLASLSGQPWVMEPRGSAPRQWATALCRTAGFEPDVRYQSSDLLLHVRLVEAGHAVAFLPDLVWNAPSTAVVRPLPGNPARRIFTATRAGAGQHPAVRAVRDTLRQVACR